MAGKRKVTVTIDGVPAGARAGSALIVDAQAVAVAVEAGGGVVVTGGEAGLTRLAAPYHHVAVEAV
ncbi:MAG TPA: hypothetical protein VD813_15755 [Pseudonocardia sp.]|nr:hypothetical protein [Pseudonocardia sp.]